MVQDGGIGNSLIWVPTDEPPHMGGGRSESFLVSINHSETGGLIDRPV